MYLYRENLSHRLNPRTIMKILPASTLLLLSLLSACRQQSGSPQTSPISSPTVAPTAVALSPKVETFTLDELFKQDEGGCGMTLWEQERDARSNKFLFAKNIKDDLALMKIDGQFIRVRRTNASGEEFYGQQTSQTLVSQDGTIQVQTDVMLGKREGELIELDSGTLQVTRNGQIVKFFVKGSAGC